MLGICVYGNISSQTLLIIILIQEETCGFCWLHRRYQYNAGRTELCSIQYKYMWQISIYLFAVNRFLLKTTQRRIIPMYLNQQRPFGYSIDFHVFLEICYCTIKNTRIVKPKGTSRPVLSNETHLKRPRKRNWTLDPWRTMTPLRRGSWQMKIHRTVWLCGWSLRPHCLTQTRGLGSEAEWDPARNDPSERRLRWSWGPPSWSFLDSTSLWSLFPLCSLCSPWFGPPDTEPKEPKSWLWSCKKTWKNAGKKRPSAAKSLQSDVLWN